MSVVLEELLERGIGQIDGALTVKNDDRQRAVLYQRVQVGGLFIQVKRQPVPLADLGSYDQSYSRHHQHE